MYLLQLIIASGILYGYYHFFLRNTKFHHYNRYYLLSATVISIVIPFLQIPFYFTENDTGVSGILKTIYYSEGDAVAITASGSSFNWNFILYIIYCMVTSILFVRILMSVLKIKRIIKTNKGEKLDDIHFVNTTEPGTPFSFFRWLFWNRSIELRSEKGQQIFRHEVFHIQQKHSWDVLLIELVTMILWINPFIHIIKKEIRTIHEFLADEFSTKEENKWEYAELLLMQALQTKQKFVNPFFHNQIKRRIAMITNPQKTSHRYLRKLLALPLTVLLTLLLAFTYKNKVSENKSNYLAEKNVITTKGDKNVLLHSRSLTDTQPPVNILRGIKLKGSDSTNPPLIMIDGVVQPESNFKNIDPNFIESMNVLKAKTATDKYGEDGKNGVIEIIIKKSVPVAIKEFKLETTNTNPVTIKEIKLETTSSNPDNKIFDKADIEPSFRGGNEKWRQYLSMNANGQIASEKGAPEGIYTVIVLFIVDKEGAIHDIRALTHHGYGMEEEAIRLIAKGPKWIPAMQNGQKVVAYRKQPITFVIADGWDTAPSGESKPNLKKDQTSLTKTDIEKLSSIYPNPTTNSIAVMFNSRLAGKGEVRVTDMNGNVKMTVPTNFTKGINNLNLNVNSLAKGMYVVNVIDIDKNTTRVYKLVKQ